MIYSKENRILFPSSRIQTMLQTHSETTFSTETEQSTVLPDETGKGGGKGQHILMVALSSSMTTKDNLL